MKNVLLTGANGLLGTHCARTFLKDSNTLFKIGHGCPQDAHSVNGNVNYKNLLKFRKCSLDIIVHCAGSGSVGFSYQNPLDDFSQTVNSTAAVLEFARNYHPNATIVYPSTPAVHGIHNDAPIKESSPCNPVSPYGVHKKIAEY